MSHEANRTNHCMTHRAPFDHKYSQRSHWLSFGDVEKNGSNRSRGEHGHRAIGHRHRLISILVNLHLVLGFALAVWAHSDKVAITLAARAIALLALAVLAIWAILARTIASKP